MRKATEAYWSKCYRLNEILSKMIKDYNQIKQAVREREARYQESRNELRQGDERQRKIDIIMFGLQQKRVENYFETLDMVVKWLSESIKAETTIENVDCVARLGSRRGERPILVILTSFLKKLEVLKNTRNLTGFEVKVDEDLSIEGRRMRKELIPCLKDRKMWGHKAFLRKDTLIVNEQ